MDTSSGKSTCSRRLICYGLQLVPQRRSARRPWRRPFQGTCHARPVGSRQAALEHKLSNLSLRRTFGFLLRHRGSVLQLPTPRRCVTTQLAWDGRERSFKLPGHLPNAELLSMQKRDLSSRSANARYLPKVAPEFVGAIAPASRNHRGPSGCETRQTRAASSLCKPAAICSQNACFVRR